MTDVSNSVTSLLEALSNVRTRIAAGKKSLHKYVFVLALVELYESNTQRPNRFYLNSEIETLFEDIWTELHGTRPDANAIEHPFYYLQSDGLWFLSVKNGFEQLL